MSRLYIYVPRRSKKLPFLYPFYQRLVVTHIILSLSSSCHKELYQLYQLYHSINSLAPSSRSITSSALTALPPQTTVPVPSMAKAPDSCHLLPSSVEGLFSLIAILSPSSLLLLLEAVVVLVVVVVAPPPFFLGVNIASTLLSSCLPLLTSIALATFSPNQPVSFQAWTCAVGPSTYHRLLATPSPQAA